MVDPSDCTTTTIPQLPTFASPYSAMSRALDMSEISYLIRQDLKGAHLKSAVLVCKFWWRLFAPYLWEHVFIDADPDEKDREVLVRNGLAARSLTLSIYDPKDREGVVGYVVDRCRNVEALHLKLLSPELVVIDGEAMERRLREVWENDGAGVKNTDQERQFGIRSECKTDFLDSLLSKLPYLSELTLSIAHEDLRPEVLWCVPTLTRLRKLTIAGGLGGNGYIVHKNRLCDWDLILRTSRECKYLNSLSVSWESHKTQDANLDGHVGKVSEMFESLEAQESSARGQEAPPPPVPKNEQFPSLRTLAVSSCEMHLSQMDFFYRSCPNLRAVEFKSVQVSTHIMEKNLKSLALSCPNLLSFKFLDACKTSNRIDYSTSLLASPRTSLHSLTLSVTANATATVFGNYPAADNDYTHIYYKDDIKWTPPPSVTFLNVQDIKHPTVLLDTIASTPAGLTHLTIDGYISDDPYQRYYLYDAHPVQQSPHSIIGRLYNLENDPLLRLPTFACRDTLEYLDVSTLDVSEWRKLFKILFRRVQELKGLRFLKMGREHVLAANLELTWSDDTLVGGKGYDDDDGQTGETAKTAMTTTDEGEDENNHDNHDGIEEQEESGELPDDQDREKVFNWFPTVEHLYLVDTESRRFHSQNPFLTQHQASALVRMMPRLKVMSFNREDAKGGLEGIIETCPKVSFNFMMRQK
ncbi:hypothetical protein EC957_005088 [Mortierella hygrophila]|uniref:F-box domain-containing protein n=1 Tax=Mortierella hygrophila TaxID=979708 RepID=A0A9P6F1G1_9FUNG|nr:hypothetical protein EC957_005088 [Mortierella hygrophila]